MTAQTAQAEQSAQQLQQSAQQLQLSAQQADRIASLVTTLNGTNAVLNATNRQLAAVAAASGGSSSGGGGVDTNSDGEEYNQGFGSTVDGDIKFLQQDSFEILSKMREVSDVYAVNITGYVTFESCFGATNVALQVPPDAPALLCFPRPLELGLDVSLRSARGVQWPLYIGSQGQLVTGYRELHTP